MITSSWLTKAHLLSGCADGAQNQDQWAICWTTFTAELNEGTYVMESVLWDAEGQKLSGPAWVGFVVSEVKTRVSAEGMYMTKMEEHSNAWELALKEKDFSLVDKLYHPNYRGTDNLFGVEMNLENDKSTLLDYITMVLIGPSLNIYENEEQLYYEQYHRYKDSDIFMLAKHTFSYESKNIISRDIVFEELNYDPSEGQDWNWEDYE